MRVHLINPSHLAFGVGVITPRWLYVLAAATPREVRRSHHRRRDARADRSRPASSPATSSASASTPATRCAATRSAGWPASAAPGSSSAASTRRCIPRRRTSSAARTRWSRATATWSGRRSIDDCVAGAPQPVYEGGRVDGRAVPAGALGPAAARTGTCGRRCRRCAAARSTARSVRCGDRRPEAAAARRRRGRSARSSSCAGGASASSRSPTTTSIPVTLTESKMAARRARPGAAAETSKRIRAERFELMERLAELPERHGVLHADHHGSGRGSGVPRRDAARRASGARWSASSR